MHNIQKTDKIYLAGEKAWHGMGTVVPKALGPKEVVKTIGLDWTVSKQPVYNAAGNEIKGFKAIRRDDTGDIFNILTKRYQPIQNVDFFELAYSLGDNVKLETAGTLGGGRKLFALAQVGSVFEAAKGDEVVPYIALTSSHDGSLRLGALPTSIRIVCQNTLNMALKAGNKKFVSVKHTTNAGQRLAIMRSVLASYDVKLGEFKVKVGALNDKIIATDKKLVEFYTNAYLMLNGQPKNDKAEKVMNETLVSWQDTFEAEKMLTGSEANYWLAANSITNHIQHDEPKRKVEGWENRQKEKNLVGLNDDQSAQVFNLALSLG